MGLALFSAARGETTFDRAPIGLWAIVVFVAPLAFARQMFQRTHSLQVATDELARKQAENEHQALHDASHGPPEPDCCSSRSSADAIEPMRTRRWAARR